MIKLTKEQSRVWMAFKRSIYFSLVLKVVKDKLEEWRAEHEGKPDEAISKARVQAIKEVLDILNQEITL